MPIFIRRIEIMLQKTLKLTHMGGGGYTVISKTYDSKNVRSLTPGNKMEALASSFVHS